MMACTNECEMKFIKHLKENFKITMGSLDSFLGLQIKEMAEGIFVNQNSYITKNLTRFNMKDLNSVKSPCKIKDVN